MHDAVIIAGVQTLPDKHKIMDKLKTFIPILEWLPNYKAGNLSGDFWSGLTIGIMLIPQGMAYAMLAGLPPIYGLYAGITPLVVYAVFGTSRQLSVGPVALASLLVLTGVGQLAETGSSQFIALAIGVSLLAGLMQVLFGVFRLGFLINFLSHPVLSGFTSAAAVIIILSQLKNLLGITMPRTNLIQEIATAFAHHIHETNIPTLLLGLSGIIAIAVLKKINRNLPTGLMVIIPGMLLVWGFNLHLRGVDIVKDIPAGFPAFSFPDLSFGDFRQLLPLAFTIFLVSFIESLAIAKALEARHGDYRISPNQELIALGLSKMLGALFHSYPTTGSFSRSAVNDELGAKTQMSSLIAVFWVAVTLIFLTPLLYFMPKALLGAVVVVAAYPLVNYKEAARLWRTDRRDFLTLMVTFVLTLTMGIQDGVLAGVLLSLGIVIYRNSKPHIAVLGRLPGSDNYRNLSRFPEAIDYPDMLIVRFDAQLYFGNSAHFTESMERMVAEKGRALKVIILDASNINDIDSTGVDAFNELLHNLHKQGIAIYIASAIGPVRDTLYTHGLMQKIGLEYQFLNIPDAVDYYEARKNQGIALAPSLEAVQTNVEIED